MPNLKATVTEEINASTKQVWKALTDPQLIKQYFFGTEAISDWKEGSSLTFKGEWEGKAYEDHGKILEIKPEKLFRYTYWSSMSGTDDKPENYNEVRYILQDKGEQTLLSIEQDGVKTEESKAHSEKNWKMIIEGLKKVV